MIFQENETYEGQIVLVNPFIHNTAKLSRENFLEKVEYVSHIRTAKNSQYVSFYITSIHEYNNLIKFHNLINNGVFDFKNYHVFAVAIQPKLYNWFKTTSIVTSQKQITCWLAGLYFFQPDNNTIHNNQIYKPLLEEIHRIIREYYKGFILPNFPYLQDKWITNNDTTLFEEQNRCILEYKRICNLLCQTNPPEFLQSPFDYEVVEEWGTNYNFQFIEAFFSDSDWKNIIIGNSRDSLRRVESKDTLWLKWKHIFSTFDLRNNFVYSFYYEPTVNYTKNPIKRRDIISHEVKNQVWNRDGGKCVECGSREKLEFDHIIPFSKNGSSTYRNIQLLCESCNRKKSNRI